MGEAKSYFFCGIGGSGMLPLALIVQGRGHRVAGSDRTLDQGRLAPKFEFLRRRGIDLFPQEGSGLASADQILVTSAAIEETVADVVRARDLGARRVTRPELLAELFNEAEIGIAVGGTSGKSTVTGMIGWILHALDRKPTVMNGAVMKNFITREAPFASALVGSGETFVSEVDESDGSITLYRPSVAVLTNITFDHRSLEELRHLFSTFARQAATVVVNSDDREASSVAAALSNTNIRTYSVKDHSADLFASRIIEERSSISFTVNGVAVRLKVPGRHNVENALAALAAAEAVGVPIAQGAKALGRFRGLKRRLEKVGEANGVVVIDDFAHNPDKISATLSTIHAFPGRVLTFFQPHGYGPLRMMKDSLIECLKRQMRDEDIIIMPDPVYFGGTTTREVGSEDIVMALQESGLHAEYLPFREDCAQRLCDLARPGDTIVVMGARDDTLSLFAHEVLALLRRGESGREPQNLDLEPRPAPVDARVVAGQLQLAEETPVSAILDTSAIEAARESHFETASRFCRDFLGTNVGPGFNARLETLRHCLSLELTRERSLQLGLHVRGLERMLPLINERIDEVAAADVRIFVNDLSDLVHQFPVFRDFVREATTGRSVAGEVRKLTNELATHLINQPDASVAPDLKQAISMVQAAAAENPSRLTSLALVRTVANVFRAVGRSITSHGQAISKQSGETFDKLVGAAGGTTLALLVVGPPAVFLLTRLAAALPDEFRFVENLLRLL